MSKFNQSSVGKMKTVNKAGGQAYKISSSKQKLALSVLTSFFGEKKYYGDNSKEIVQLTREVIMEDPHFVSNLALFAREQFNLRTISHVLAAELAFIEDGKPFARFTINSVCKRPDDMTEIMSYYLATHGKPIPNSLKKGLADAFGRFDEYQLAKYNRKQDITLKDVFRLVSPTANKGSDRYALYGRLLEGTLEIPYTWETELSAKGNKAEVWEELISSKRLPYMATLRNLRNIHQSGAANAQQAYDYIANPLAVEKSRQLPFRFYSAHREMQQQIFSRQAISAVEQALEHSLSNAVTMPGRSVFLSDVSGSMGNLLSQKGSVTYKDIALLMAAMSNSIAEEPLVGVFGEEFKFLTIPNKNSVLSTMNQLAQQRVGHATYLHKPLEYLLQNAIKVDRIVIFSDMQAYTQRQMMWNGWGGTAPKTKQPQELIEEYRRLVNPDVWVHSVDLTGHSTTQFVGKNVNLMGGWSEKILDYIMIAEKGVGNLVKEIEIYN